jgi:transposase
MDMRELKGLEIAARCRITHKSGKWLVPSQSGKGTYAVVLKPEGDSCTCEDFTLTNEPCKHIHAARIVRERDHGGELAPVVVDEVPKKPTYKQDWPNYDKAQMTEKHRFLELLYDLCRGVLDFPQPKTGRRHAPLSDMIFACAYKVYSTFSSRRFACDLKDAHAKGYLTDLMHSVRICAYFENPVLTPALHDLIVQSSLPLRTVETVFAPDSTGFSTCRFVKWYDHKYGVTRQEHDWIKVHAICGVKTNIVTTVRILDRDANDCPQFKPLVETTAQNGFTVKEVPADKAYLSRENLELVEGLGGTAFVPFKTNSIQGEAGSLWERMYFYYNFRREDFLRHYHARSNAESTFAMIKAKFRDNVRSKTDVAMKNEVLCKFLCHNLCVLIQSQHELGIEPVFWGDEPKRAVILPLSQPS